MKYCNDYAALLDLFVDGELTPAEMADVQAHLDTCSGCRAYVDDALALRAAFPDVEETVVSEGFAEGVMAAVAASAKKPVKKKNRWLQAAMPLAACLAVVIVLRNGPVNGGNMGGMGAAKTAAAPAMAETTAEAAPAAEAPAAAKAEFGLVADNAEDAKAVYEEAAEIAAEPAAGSTTGADTNSTFLYTAKSSIAAAETEDVALMAQENADIADPSKLFPARMKVPAEAARFLEGFSPAGETEEELHYHLSREECSTLQGQLKHAGITPLLEEHLDADTDVILVLVLKK